MKNRKLIVFAAALALLLLIAVPAYRTLAPSFEPAAVAPSAAPEEPALSDAADAAPEEPALSDAADAAPDFTVYDAEGNEVRLSDYRGKSVVINFWATWCPPCRAELPYFDAAFAERGKDVAFLMIDLTDGSRETQETVRAFLNETGYAFPVCYDTQLDAAAAYGVNSIPLTVLIDAQGRQVASHLGSMTGEQLSALLDSIA